jgi:hypothetical protein
MKCPNCSSEVPPGRMCERCGAPLKALPSAAPLPANPVFGAPPLAHAGAQGLGSVPLTVGQKARLLVDCLPLPFFVLALVFTLTILDDITGAPPPIALPLFLGFVILVVGWTALQRLRDLASSVALVREDLLQRSWRSNRRGPGRFRGRFERLGKLTLVPKVYFHAQPGLRYHVVYSPASKIVWTLEPLERLS